MRMTAEIRKMLKADQDRRARQRVRHEARLERDSVDMTPPPSRRVQIREAAEWLRRDPA